MDLEYNGVVKNCETRAHRHTVHFVLNNVVEPTGDGFGNWDDAFIIIVEPYKYHINEFVRKGFGVDSYTFGSVNLSYEALLFIQDKDIDKIPISGKGKWNIVLCSDALKNEVRKYFNENNILIKSFNSNNPGHMISKECVLERNLSYLDMAINYIKDNTFYGNSYLELSMEEFATILNIYNTNELGSNLSPLSFPKNYALLKYDKKILM